MRWDGGDEQRIVNSPLHLIQRHRVDLVDQVDTWQIHSIFLIEKDEEEEEDDDDDDDNKLQIRSRSALLTRIASMRSSASTSSRMRISAL